MRAILLSLVIVAMISCSAGSSQVASLERPASDSLSAKAKKARVATEEDPDALIEAIQLEIEKSWQDFDEKEANEFTIHSSFVGYENTSKGKWFVDSLLNLHYCEVDWGMEGSSGSYTYVFEGENVLAGEEQNYYNDYEETVGIHRGFKPTFGFSKTNGTENDSLPYFLREADYLSKNEQAKDAFSNLIHRIRELHGNASSADGEITIVSEKIVNYGDDFTETEKYTLSKHLFDIIVKDQ